MNLEKRCGQFMIGINLYFTRNFMRHFHNLDRKNMIKIKNKYVIGTHVMFFEIEMYKDFIDGLINLLETVENKENIIIDLCFNMSQRIEKIDYNKISICDLRRMLPEYRDRKEGMYQVDASGSQLKFSKIYKNIDDALDKFFEIVQGTS